jgi:hypothetical protein
MRFGLTALALLLAALPAFAQYQPIITTPGSADSLSSGGAKIDHNFADLYAHLWAPITGDVSIPSDTNSSTINVGAVTNAKLAQMTALTVKCNPLSSAAAAQDCTGTQIAALLGYSGGSGSGIPNQLELCKQTGVDPTGVADSWPATYAAFAAVAGTKTVLKVDCPVFLNVASNGNRQIFVGSFTNVDIGPSGSFIVNNMGVNVFVWENATDNLWTCENQTACIVYTGTPGSTIIQGPTWGPYAAGVTAQYNEMGEYLVTNAGNTFQGSSGSGSGFTLGPTGPFWNGQSPFLSIFHIRGASQRLVFRNLTVAAPIGANPANFIPVVVGIWPEWQTGLAVTTASSSSPGTLGILPTDIEFDHPVFDGFDMGFNGTGSLRLIHPIFKRYSDLQDGTTGTITYSGNFAAGASSATLSASVYPSGWALPTGTYCQTMNTPSFVATGSTITPINSSTSTLTIGTLTSGRIDIGDTISGTGVNGNTTILSGSGSTWVVSGNQTVASTTISGVEQIGMTLTQGLTTATNFVNCINGNTTTIPAASTSAVTTSGNVGGVNTWFAPPHSIYVYNQGTAGWQGSMQIHDALDVGPPVFATTSATRRSTSSGTLLSLKIEATYGTVVDGYTSLRPDGFLDLEPDSSAGTGGVIRNVFVSYNSTTPTANNGIVWGLRFPGNSPFNNISFDNWTIADTATEPAAMPFSGTLGNSQSYDLSFTNWKIFLNDWPQTATWYPGIQIAGQHENFQGGIHFANCSSTQQYRGSVYQQGSNLFTQSNVDMAVFGWRQLPITFTGTLASGATTATLYGTGWPYVSGTYKVIFSDGEVRYIYLTNGSTSVPTFTALTGAVTATATGAGALAANYNGYINRVVFSQGGLGIGNFVHVRDVDNGWESTSQGLVTKEMWTQEWTGTPASPTTPIIVPSGFSVDETGYLVNTSLTGVTGTMGVGFAGSTTALLATGNLLSTNNMNFGVTSPVTSPGTAVLLTPSSGTVTGGVVTLGIRASAMHGAF